MSAVYGVRYSCDAPGCGAVELVWQEGNNQPSLHGALPAGWRRSSYANTSIKPPWQRPLACPQHAHEIEEADMVYADWQKRHGNAYQDAHESGRTAMAEWVAANPRPSLRPFRDEEEVTRG